MAWLDNSENDIGRFNVLFFCFSYAGLMAKAKIKDVKTPFLISASASTPSMAWLSAAKRGKPHLCG